MRHSIFNEPELLVETLRKKAPYILSVYSGHKRIKLSKLLTELRDAWKAEKNEQHKKKIEIEALEIKRELMIYSAV